jgi:3-polyprenyl-4-hydroxybenzoate decarboxylase
MFIAVAVEQRYCGHAKQVGFLTSQVHAAAYMNRFVVVVDHDVDPTSLDDVIWAMSTRCDPAGDIDIMRKSWGSKADPLLVDQSAPYNSRAVIDATRPFERFDDFPLVATASPELLDRVRQKWAHVLGDTPSSRPAGTVRGTAGTRMEHM